MTSQGTVGWRLVMLDQAESDEAFAISYELFHVESRRMELHKTGERMTRPHKVSIESRKTLLTEFLSVEEVTLRFEKYSGQMSDTVRRLNLERGDSAAILLYDRAQDCVTLVEQFKWPTFENGSGWILETVAGVVDDAESPEEAAMREAYEETGFAVSIIERIATFYVSPGGSSERIHLFCGYVDVTSQLAAAWSRKERIFDSAPFLVHALSK